MYLPWLSSAHALYFTEIASYIHSSEAGCILMYALVFVCDCNKIVALGYVNTCERKLQTITW